MWTKVCRAVFMMRMYTFDIYGVVLFIFYRYALGASISIMGSNEFRIYNENKIPNAIYILYVNNFMFMNMTQ